MLAQPAHELGVNLKVLAESDHGCARAVVPQAPVGSYTDLKTLREFAQTVDVLTFDHEHVPSQHLAALAAEGVNLQPNPAALIYAQDKLRMRQAVQELGLANPRWAAVSTPQQVLAFGQETGWPLVLKTPRGGYDGKGVLILDHPDQLDSPELTSWFAQLAADANNNQLLVEEKVDFSRELAALVARSPSGEMKTWVVAQSIQVNSVCDEVIAPAPFLGQDLAERITKTAQLLASQLGVTGVMALELFEVPSHPLGFLINELAMRPHNSGHWTQDGSVTSQFEQHIRAVLDLPLGATSPLAQVTLMKNFLGGSNRDIFASYRQVLASDARIKLHFYGKEPRPGRKIGHLNISGSQEETQQLRQLLAQTANLLTQADHSRQL